MNEKIINEVNTYLQGDRTVEETANYLGISTRTFQLHIKKLRIINPELYQMVLKKQKSNMIAGRKRGGQIGKRGATYSEEEVIQIANDIITNQLTYTEASLKYDIPSSTIHDIVHSDYIDSRTRELLDMVADANKRGIIVEDKFRRQLK